MGISRRTFVASTIAALAAPTVLRRAHADAPQFAFKLQHPHSAVSSEHDKFLAPWAKQIEAQSGGRIRIDLFPSMELGGAPAQLFDQARDGSADFVWTAPSFTPGRFPKIELFELPFLPSRRALVSSKAIEDFAEANLGDEFRDVRPICFACSDRSVLHSNRPVQTVQDLKGLRLHVQTKFAGDAVGVLGARGVPMPTGQLPLAITQRVIDGCLDPWNIVPALKLQELLKAHTDFADSSFSAVTFVLAMNKASYDRLPADLKKVIDDNSRQAAASMAGAMWDIQAAAVADMVTARGDSIITLQSDAVGHWRKATEPVVAAWLKQMKERKADGGKLLDNAHSLIEKYLLEPEPKRLQQARAEQPKSEPAQTDPSQPAKSQPAQQPQPQSPPEAPAEINTTARAEPPAAASSAPPPASATPPAAPATAPPAASAAPASPHAAVPATAPAAPGATPAAPAPSPAASVPGPAAPSAPPPAAAVPPAVSPPAVASTVPPAPPSAVIQPVTPAPAPVPVPPVIKPPPPPKALDFPI
jgi:TRAP-type transport system periplasmic protein